MNGTVGTIRGLAHRSGKRRWQTVPRIAPELLVILACVSLIWGAVAFTLWGAKVAAVESARRQTVTLARAFAESSERISAGMDRELLALRASFSERGSAFDLRAWVRTQTSPDDLSLQITITDSAGVAIQSTSPLKTVPVSIADREHFLVQLDPAHDALFISKPVIGRVTRRCSVQYSRKLMDRDGHFAGVAVNSVSCDDLSRFYQTVHIDNGFIMLSGLDGVIRGYGPIRPDLLGTDVSHVRGFESALWTQEGTLTATAPWDHVKRVVSFRRLNRYPLLVMVGYDDAKVFAQYWPTRDRAIEIGGAATIIIMCLGLVWIQQRLRSGASRQALVVTLENMSQGIVMIDADGGVLVINRRATELLGLPTALLDPRRKVYPSEAYHLGLLPRTGNAEPDTAEPGVVHKNGRIIESLSRRLAGGGQVRTFTDVTERRITEARIRHMAHHDSLTGLANREMLNEHLAELSRQDPSRQTHTDGFGLICLDLDGFKIVNDTLGHEAGDRLLRDVSRRLHGLPRNGGLLARTGGDEFALLCSAGAQPAATLALADAIKAAMTEPIEIDGTQFRLTASVGLAFHPSDGATAVEIVRHADTAMYQAKSLGHGLVVRFDPEMDRSQHERSLIERDLRRALGNGEFEVWFQPRFETQHLRITGFEALARWRHPEKGFISPGQFIPVAEQCGLIDELGLRVLKDACRFAGALPDGRIAVNLSPLQFLPNDLADAICDVLAENKLSPSRLELEITEGVLIADEAQALKTLNSLNERGLHLALDDFGTGYASLSYLRRFPFDRIKIDQSFVRAQEHDAATRAIIECMLTMARRLGLEVTAEGVETDLQLNILLSQGCPEVQGFLLGHPMPATEAQAFYADHIVADRVWDLTTA